ncbi:UDP-glucose 4-epimerase [Algoriphagus sp. 4150]|uniref:NAD-dependent epimerase/dehydratase family protein n=1 Tax=Algoriphagus sp. 4150 TaxID=2817756 RepID=UPI00285DED80|nr:NAD-dependent epimerase/dehydratase family protein [Algoriphagus sp. 4150]MDR7127722.1 UDP-glucose 4-epimerase [Algoriphagus sp. 4150]
MIKVLILGGTGFLGSALAENLSKRIYHVRIYSPSAEKVKKSEGIEAARGYIEDFETLRVHLEWADHIYHFVSTTNPKSSYIDPSHDIKSNLLPLIPVLNFLKENTEKYLLFCSSGGAVYGVGNGKPIVEDHPKSPISSYGIVKSTMEDYILYYKHLFGIKALILRPSNIYGKKNHDIGKQGLISTLVNNVVRNRSTDIWVSLTTSKDYLFVDDFVNAVILLIHNQTEGVYNLSSGQTHTIQNILDTIFKVTGQYASIDNKIGDASKIDVPVNISSEKMKTKTGWKMKTSLETGINNIYKSD